MPDLCERPASAKSSPTVSVVMANFNGGAFLAEAVTSVLSQSMDDLELIVSDDASSDNSLDVLRRFIAVDPRLRLVTSDRTTGAGAARNRALEIARGAWLAVVDSDDLIHPRRLERLVACAVSRGADIIADDQIYFSSDTRADPQRLFQQAQFAEPLVVDAEGLLADGFAGGPNMLGYLKPVMRRPAIGELRYRTNLRVGEDLDFLLRLALSGLSVTVVPEPTYLYRRHRTSLSYRLAPTDAAEMVGGFEAILADYPDLSPELKRLLALRIRATSRTAARETVLRDLKSRRFSAAARGLLGTPEVARDVVGAAASSLHRRVRSRLPAEPRAAEIWLVSGEGENDRGSAGSPMIRVPDPRVATPDDLARLTADTANATRLLTRLPEDHEALGYLSDPSRLVQVAQAAAVRTATELVHVRTPTYKRPEELGRALRGLIAQSHADWICDVLDDDPEGAGRTVVEDLSDSRIRYTQNSPRLRAAKNIDRCFSRENPHGASFFCVLEDDNQLLPTFMADNIRVCREEGVEIVLRNQLVEHDCGTPDARLSDAGLLESAFVEGRYAPDRFRLALMADIGVSNGGLFWSDRAASDLEINMDCSATLQEYLRTFAVVEPIYVAMTPLAVWAENGVNTTRDLGHKVGWLRRELDLKRSVQVLQRHVWSQTASESRRGFLDDCSFRYPASKRATGMIKSLSQFRVRGSLPPGEIARLAVRGLLIRLLGRPEPGLQRFLRTTGGMAG